MLDPLTALARAWYVTMFMTTGFCAALSIYPYWTSATYWEDFNRLWIRDL